eukprot:SAG11_NODE_1352_length_5131_cov_19.593402_3_plen_61_part_00
MNTEDMEPRAVQAAHPAHGRWWQAEVASQARARHYMCCGPSPAPRARPRGPRGARPRYNK